MKAIYAKKKLMTRIFNSNGHQIPVTIVEVPENTVTQIKTLEKDGYNGIQIGVGSKRKLNKPLLGHAKGAKISPAKLFEVKTEKEYKVGDKIGIDSFKEGEMIGVTAISKGKGFAGTVKRHNFTLGPKTHGSNNYRQPGSIGSMYPQRVVKGRRMAGHLGADQVTVKNLEIAKVDSEKKLLMIRGAVPGANESYVLVWSNIEEAASQVEEKANED